MPVCCATCEDAKIAKLPEEEQFFAPRLFVHCECGNKRCPKSRHHIFKCTGSNEVDQIGLLA